MDEIGVINSLDVQQFNSIFLQPPDTTKPVMKNLKPMKESVATTSSAYEDNYSINDSKKSKDLSKDICFTKQNQCSTQNTKTNKLVKFELEVIETKKPKHKSKKAKLKKFHNLQ